MRVVAGRAGGLRLKAVPGRGTRPTTDRVKESVFGILGERCVDAVVLDLFAGTGSLGIEALSRGAARAVFVERDRSALRVLRENLLATGFADRAQVWARDAMAILAGDGSGGGGAVGPFDLVFLDPPYGSGLAELAVRRLGERADLLSPGAVVVAEHSNHQALPEKAGGLALRRRQRYGETVVSFYRTAVDQPGTAVPEAGERER
ncbi:MAG TPA: 16S rRNA (guanine(966)-N(2))-methyltransferase RsmD [Firmicutes bacterium]|nr:16S rRNA (guanine(966)-N(2))-methyltransferase RsmD [Bacillota bacterium]